MEDNLIEDSLSELSVVFVFIFGFLFIYCFSFLIYSAFFKYNIWCLCIFIAICCVLLGFIILGIIKFFSIFKITFDIIEKKSKDN